MPQKLKKLDTLRNTTDTKKMDTLRNSPDTRKLVTLRNTVPWIGKSENLLETEGIRCLWQLGKNYLRNSPSLIYSISSIEKESGETSTELHPAHTVRLKDSVTRLLKILVFKSIPQLLRQLSKKWRKLRIPRHLNTISALCRKKSSFSFRDPFWGSPSNSIVQEVP